MTVTVPVIHAICERCHLQRIITPTLATDYKAGSNRMLARLCSRVGHNWEPAYRLVEQSLLELDREWEEPVA